MIGTGKARAYSIIMMLTVILLVGLLSFAGCGLNKNSSSEDSQAQETSGSSDVQAAHDTNDGFTPFIDKGDYALFFFEDTLNNKPIYYFLGFFEDGTVLGTSFHPYGYDGARLASMDAATRLNGKGDSQSGVYQFSGNDIVFTLSGGAGGAVIDYICQLNDSGILAFTSISRTTGHEGNGQYSYVGYVKDGDVSFSEAFITDNP